MKQVIIIGGGVGGLAAALRLASRFRVTLLEKNPRVGGKLNLWEAPHPARPHERPFRFDTGPSLLTMPHVFMDLFAAAGQDVRDHLRIIRLDPVAHFQWSDGSHFALRANDSELIDEVSQNAHGDAVGFAQLLQKGARIWSLAENFLSHAPDQLIKQSRASALGMLTLPWRIGMFSSFARTIDHHIKNQKLRDVLYQYATYTGVHPRRAPATLTVIPWVEHYFGGWHIEGGMYRLAEQLESLARKLGVEIRTNCPVEQILIDHGTARGVRLMDGAELPADAVVANSDVVYTYRNLIAPEHRRRYSDPKLNRFDAGGSALILMLGIEGTYPQLAHHTKFMPEDYRAELDAMLEQHAIPLDPCIYVCRPTKTDASLAPAGCDALFILASAPSLQGSTIDWTTEGPRYRDRIIATLEEKWDLTDLSKRIVVQRTMTPRDLRDIYNANAGSIYGIASSSLRAAFLRPPNRDRDIAGLYFAGGATHPGGGLPLVALSGKIVSELIQQDMT